MRTCSTILRSSFAWVLQGVSLFLVFTNYQRQSKPQHQQPQQALTPQQKTLRKQPNSFSPEKKGGALPNKQKTQQTTTSRCPFFSKKKQQPRGLAGLALLGGLGGVLRGLSPPRGAAEVSHHHLHGPDAPHRGLGTRQRWGKPLENPWKPGGKGGKGWGFCQVWGETSWQLW